MRLGDFGTAPAAADELDSFGWFGATVRVHPEFGELVFQDWAEQFGSLQDDDPRAVTATKELMRQLVHPDDFDEFWQLARRYRQTTQDLAKLMQAIIAGQADRPTEQPQPSAAGPVTIVESSRGVSSSPVIARLEEQGRPDLALVHVMAAERRAG